MPRRRHDDLAAQERFARHLRQARVQKGMTQQELAEAIDAAVQTISRWESAEATCQFGESGIAGTARRLIA